ncbi:hypothetical protein VCUG_01675 [Vavraia culicis subsp. floridensis]|uniref:Uncharacterized protein n=1 Tax=Vavraia culicis (isolate floridensis) TaxID=948595 RepID=L2GT36_VAVCU|nr:uncharacterized protein VCUG_01675 [Vavraia culicis subsp. floridensis]ELA46831.1 hypothetical protein VCUG_01675 [Vavraia culicis subsp. floridensis]
MQNLIVLSTTILACALQGVMARDSCSGVGVLEAECISECGSERRRHHRGREHDGGLFDFNCESSDFGSDCHRSCRDKERHVAHGRHILEKCITPLVCEVGCRDLTDRECEVLLKAFDNLRQFIYKDFREYEQAWEMQDPLAMYRIAYCNLVLYNCPFAIQMARCINESKACVGSLSLRICGDNTTFTVQSSVNFIVANPVCIPLFILKPETFLNCPIEIDLILFKYICKMLTNVRKGHGSSSGCHRGVSKLIKMFHSRCFRHDRNSVLVVKMVIIKLCVDIRQNCIDWSFGTYFDILEMKHRGRESGRSRCNFTAAINYYFGTIGSRGNTPCH